MLNGQGLLDLLAVGYLLAHWGAAYLPASLMAWVTWSDASCANLLVLLVVYLSVGRAVLGRGLGFAKGVLGSGVDAAAGATKDVLGKADLP